MSSIVKKSFSIPVQTQLLDALGNISSPWMFFFRSVWERLSALGDENSFALANNQSSAADITGAVFKSTGVSHVVFEYLVQRITTGTDATELVEGGILIFVYKPTSDSWSLVSVKEASPDDSGITFSITSAGQVQYTSSSITGTASISRIAWRARKIAAKHSQYSNLGAK